MRLIVIASLMLATPVLAENAPAAPGAADKDKFICGPSDKIEEVLGEKGYRHFFDMTAENGVIETMWIGGPQIVATAQKDEKTSCFLTTFKNVTLNPKTIEKIHEVLKSTQKDL